MLDAVLMWDFMPKRWWFWAWSGLLAIWLMIWLGLGNLPALAAASPTELPLLTLEQLQRRIKSPVIREGVATLDLTRSLIDLRPENGDFRDQFYRLLQTQLQRTSSLPLTLDLSYSRILGDLVGSQLGLRTPLYGQALAPLFTPQEQAQLERDRRRLSQINQLSRSLLITPRTQDSIPLQITVFRGSLKLIGTEIQGRTLMANTFFLGRVDAEGAILRGQSDWTATRFSQPASFVGTTFGSDSQFRNSLFFARTSFNQTEFQGTTTFQGSEFQATANFNQTSFRKLANFSRVQWRGNADFAQTHWFASALFSKGTFAQALFLTDAVFEQTADFREGAFNRLVNLRGATIAAQVDFSDTRFAPTAYLNIADMNFDPDQARLLGNPGQIGRVLSVPMLPGNENLLRNLVRNFRQLEQVADANQVEYTTERLRLRQLAQRWSGVNLNTATSTQLTALGFTPTQVAALLQRRQDQPLRAVSELLSIDTIDLATYVKVQNRLVAMSPTDPIAALWRRLGIGLSWLGLSLLLVLSDYGTNSGLVFGVGMATIAGFGVMFWVVDRLRRWYPTPILPTIQEAIWMLSSFAILLALSLSIIAQTTHPWQTILAIALVVIPLPSWLLLQIYRQGRYHNLMTSSYFTEDGSLRELRLLIGRLPIIPRFPFFRDRHQPILWDRRWNWLNYYDFSLNNFLKFGFNDIRLRDEQVPGYITTLVWYQWSLGILYIALLLWTLSRTIPGLNLLIYFK